MKKLLLIVSVLLLLCLSFISCAKDADGKETTVTDSSETVMSSEESDSQEDDNPSASGSGEWSKNY